MRAIGDVNAHAIAAWLSRRPEVAALHYAGSPDHPQRALSESQSSGFGSMMAFTLRDKELVGPILERVRVITYAESLGGVESLITYPILQTHASTPKELRDRLGVDEGLLRLSVGIEAAADLYAPPWQRFVRIELPLLSPGIFAGALLSFISSLGDFVITYFVSGPGATTLPVYIFGMIRTGVTPEVNALSAIFLLASVALITIAFLVTKRVADAARTRPAP